MIPETTSKLRAVLLAFLQTLQSSGAPHQPISHSELSLQRSSQSLQASRAVWPKRVPRDSCPSRNLRIAHLVFAVEEQGDQQAASLVEGGNRVAHRLLVLEAYLLLFSMGRGRLEIVEYVAIVLFAVDRGLSLAPALLCEPPALTGGYGHQPRADLRAIAQS